MVSLSTGSKAWLGLAAYVVVADTYLIVRREKTMSAVFGDMLSHPVRRWPVLVVWGFLSMHLHREVLPKIASQLDPLGNSFLLGEKVWYAVTRGPKETSN